MYYILFIPPIFVKYGTIEFFIKIFIYIDFQIIIDYDILTKQVGYLRGKIMIDEFVKNCTLSDTQLKTLLESTEFDSKLRENADIIRKQHYGTDVYIRGLIEFTNFCKNDCYYCGIRKDNKNAHRYRLSKEDIMECCKDGYSLGFRTFVLQGGEDPYFTDEKICDIVYSIKEKYSDCAVTLSIGEKSKESYKAYFDAGADRYLLRHETADETHYSKLHPHSMSLKTENSAYSI